MSASVVKELDQLLLVNNLFPSEVGLFRQRVEYTCLHASNNLLAVGCEQGYVWVVDVATRRLLREIMEVKSAVRTVKLCSAHTYVAQGTADGILVVSDHTRPQSKQLVKEKSGSAVTALLWNEPGNTLFVGYASGKLLSFQFSTKDCKLESSPLLECGSLVLSMSYSHPHLLISTITLPLLLNTLTGASTQVGSRERKQGEYGGCFLSPSELLVGRPGLRLWLADNQGKVQSTAKFKQVLQDDKLPVIPLYGGVLLPLVVQDSWQFSSLEQLDKDLVAAVHNNTLVVLEPKQLKCIGGMTLGQAILDFSTTNGNIYLLCRGHQRRIVQVSLPVMEESVAVELDEAAVEPSGNDKPSNEAVTNSVPVVVVSNDDQESVALNEQEELRDHTMVVGEDMNGSQRSLNNLDQEQAGSQDIAPEKEGFVSKEDNKPVDISKDESLQSELITSLEKYTKQSPKMKHVENTITKNLANKDNEDNISEQQQPQAQSSNPSLIRTARAIELKFGQQVADIKSKLSSVSELKEHLLSPYYSSQQESPSAEPPPVLVSEPLSEEEIRRRAKMSAMAIVQDEDELVVRKSTSKRKPKRRKKKHNKLTPVSSTHSSIEHLPEALLEEQEKEEEVKEDTVPLGEIPVIVEATKSEVVNEEKMVEKEVVRLPVSECNVQQCDNDEEDEVRVKDDPIQAAKDEDEVVEKKEEKKKEEKEKEEEKVVEVQEEDGDKAKYGTDKAKEDTETQKEEKNGEGPLLIEQPEMSNQPETEAKFLALDETEQEMLTLHRLRHFTRRRANAFKDVDKSPEPKADKEDLIMVEEHFTHSSSLAPQPSANVLSSSDNESESVSKLSVSSTDEPEHHPLEQPHSESEEELLVTQSSRSHPRPTNVTSGFYSLCSNMVQQTKEADPVDGLSPPYKRRADASFIKASAKQAKEPDKKEDKDIVFSAKCVSAVPHSGDIWLPITAPSTHSIQCVCLSARSLWVIDVKGTVYWTIPGRRELRWEVVKHPMGSVSSSASGKIVWGVYNGHAYARQGISDLNPAGALWKNMTKSSELKRHVKQISCDEKAVWLLTLDGRVFFRRHVSEGSPEGTVWKQVQSKIQFNVLSCCCNIVWALDQTGRSYVREGITSVVGSGDTWVKADAPILAGVTTVEDGIVWGIDVHSNLYFHYGATSLDPAGCGPWWQVALSTTVPKSSPTSPTDALWKLVSSERSFLQSTMSRLSAAVWQNRIFGITACLSSGVCVLAADGQIHGCWNMATGYYYERVCTDEMFDLSNWKQVAAGNEVPWVVRDDNELSCIVSKSTNELIECQSKVTALAASQSAVWVVSNKQIWSRQGITPEDPSGFSWDYIELGSHMQELQIVQLAIGNRVAWAVDHRGGVHFRFGIHPREPGTGMSPAWIPVEESKPLVQISISPNDLLVWACDINNNVYARVGVTNDFPVGEHWEVILGELGKQVAVTSDWVFILTPTGELLSRHGISPANPTGDYWRRLPGKFEKLSVNKFGQLFFIDEAGSVFQQRIKILKVSNKEDKQKDTNSKRLGNTDLEKTVAMEDWEMI